MMCIIFHTPTIIGCAYLVQPTLSITTKYGITNAAVRHCNRPVSKPFILHHLFDVQQAREPASHLEFPTNNLGVEELPRPVYHCIMGQNGSDQ